ncbi:ATPase [Clostridium manihotivorum]|uniref:ATPase n=1 Tax=Clostridium manihotivorum TaxID=2320868 RepID=A0A410DY12_9CLOT|nr:ATPase [Clostridium manihotivorum]QAA34066.1 ATPase [Clostridium manihotivorum]
MALEVIKEITNAENRAEELVREANKKSKEIIDSAIKIGEEEYKKVLIRSKQEAEIIINYATEKATKEIEAISIKGNNELNGIKEGLEEEKKYSAVRLIIERIVGIHGNS